MRAQHLFVTLILVAVAGCAKEGYQTADRANQSLIDTKGELIRDKAQLQTTVDTLNDLVYHSQTDMRPQYIKFSNAVDALDKSATQTKESNNDTMKKRADYLAQWRTEAMENRDPDLRDRAMKRIAETQKRYDAANEKLSAANASFIPLLEDLKAIRDYISTDLTSNGIHSISDRATSARNRSIAVNQAIDAAVTEIDGVAAEMSPTTVEK